MVGYVPPEFRAARYCFVSSAVILGGMDVVWQVQTDKSPLVRITVGMLLWGLIGAGLPESFRWIKRRQEQAQSSAAGWKTEAILKADEKQPTGLMEPTLSLLMNSDFPGLHKLHGKPVLQFADGESSEIEDVLYVDFKAGSKFVGIYVPSSSKSIEILSSIALSAEHLGDELSKILHVVSKAPGENPQDISALVYTGRVYLYHQDHLTHRQIAEIEEAATKHSLTVVLRGPDYLTRAWLEWKRKSTK